jgi:superfamily II DNA or RNA helicase
LQLRDYQTRAIHELRLRLLAHKRRLLLVAPTGAGKTVIASEMIRSAVSRGTPTLFLAHRKELVDQPSRKLDELGIDHGIVMASHWRSKPWLPVQVASVQTLVRRLESKPAAGLIIIDEAHHARAATYERIIDAYPGVPVIGLTATPWRTDGKGLGDLFEDSYLVTTPSRLVADGWLVPVSGFAFDSPDLRTIKRTAGDYNEHELGAVMSETRLVGNIVEQWLRHARGADGRGLRTVVFAVHVEHSKQIVEQFRAAGVAAEHLDDQTPTREREAVFARLHSGQTTVLSNVGICTEGWDEPLLGCVILARPTLSVGLAIQMIGRGRRPAPGKPKMLLHDHAGVVMQHGLPDDERDWSLTADVRVGKKQQGAAGVAVRACKTCFALYSPLLQACPLCGAPNARRIKQITTVEGEAIPLEEVKARVVASEDRMRQEYQHLCRLARQRGYKPGWAKMRFHGRYKQWPRREWEAAPPVGAAPSAAAGCDHA